MHSLGLPGTYAWAWGHGSAQMQSGSTVLLMASDGDASRRGREQVCLVSSTERLQCRRIILGPHQDV